VIILPSQSESRLQPKFQSALTTNSFHFRRKRVKAIRRSRTTASIYRGAATVEFEYGAIFLESSGATAT
jgi:hypothetical protein